MLALSIDDFMIELAEGSIRNVGAPTKRATAKLFDVESAGARAFGDDRVKLVFEDDTGNEVQVALFPDEARRLAGDLESLLEDSPVSD